jgi:hypothetical protein
MRLWGWWRAGPRQVGPTPEWWERLARVEHDQKQLALAWEETYGKVRRALATLAKRQKREQESEEGEDAPLNGQVESAYQEAVRRGFFGGG